LLIALSLTIGCSHQSDLSRPAAQDNFGVQMARMNLWREAMFRFQRATEINPGNPMAHNNLAVAYEANGDFEKARKEYLEALKLDKSNQYIQKNYSRFVEFTSRNKKRTPAKAASGSTPQPPLAPNGVSITAPPMNSAPPGTMAPGDVTQRPEGAQPAIPQPAPPATPSDQPKPPTPVPPHGGA
jgi:hypothetical protein